MGRLYNRADRTCPGVTKITWTSIPRDFGPATTRRPVRFQYRPFGRRLRHIRIGLYPSPISILAMHMPFAPDHQRNTAYCLVRPIVTPKAAKVMARRVNNLAQAGTPCCQGRNRMTHHQSRMRIVMTAKTESAFQVRETKEAERDRQQAPVHAHEQKQLSQTEKTSERDWERQTFLLWPSD
jgi:hypothetical protein